MLNVSKIIHGKCQWCQQETEVVRVKAQDGLDGVYCKKDLWTILKNRSPELKKGGEADAPTKAGAAA
jgi:hypothetical protein